MKLQIIEPMWGGHHTNYIRALLPSVRRLLDAGVLHEAVITVTARHARYMEAEGVFPTGWPGITIDDELSEVSPAPSLGERFDLFRSRADRMKNAGADAVLYTTADYDVMAEAVCRVSRQHRKPPASKWVGVLHYGYPAEPDSTPKETIKRLIYNAAWRVVGWDNLLLVNPLVYEPLACGGRDPRMLLLPDPVPQPPDFSQADARSQLGIPTEGRYVGFVGMMDKRKAIPELCRGFVEANLGEGVRLLLAGQLSPEHQAHVNGVYGEEVRQGKFVLIDRPLSEDELRYGFAAVDVHSVLQYRRVNLSANVLKAVSTGRPVVADSYGHPGMVVERFNAGVTCRLQDPASISSALRAALEMAPNHVPNESARRLLQFHNIDNFARLALGVTCGTAARDVLGQPLTWQWVLGRDKAACPS